MDERVGQSVPKDTDTLSSNEDAEDLQKELQKKNRKAARTLLYSITTTEAKKQSVFYHLIEKLQNGSDGFASGHFYKEWKALEKRYKMIDSKK